MRNVSKKLLFYFLASFQRPLGSRASILMYHSVGSKAEFSVTCDSFEEQLQVLTNGDYELVFVSEILRRLQAGESIAKCIAITFDDGYEDFYTNVFPYLKKYSVPVSLFFITGLAGKVRTTSDGISLTLLNETELDQLTESGYVEVLPHTVTHTKLNSLADHEAEIEISDSYRWLCERYGQVPRVFAFPSGKYNENTIALLQKLEFSGSVTVRPGLVYPDAFSDRYLLPRNHVGNTTSRAEFRSMLGSGVEWYARLKNMVRFSLKP